ncbi:MULTISPECIES: acyl carrier protein [unclassified Streptomyces]|uniref:acyl carrier protein n=1 Tax=unclassified Streptomyces TaxID=2593676 RepID=UPI0004C2518F|nr:MULTISPECIES: acyl carrier protein [unclassified Streptomyces]
MMDDLRTNTPEQGVDQAYAREVVLRVVAAYAPDGSGGITPATVLEEELGYNSLRLVELSFAIEELFGLGSPGTTHLPPIETVAQLQDFVAATVAAGTSEPPTPEAVEDALARV